MTFLHSVWRADGSASTVKLSNGVYMPRIQLGVYLTSGRETTNAVASALEVSSDLSG